MISDRPMISLSAALSTPRQPFAWSNARPAVASVVIYMRDLTGGGVERQVLTLAGELQGLGLDVSVVVHQARGELCARLPGQLRIVSLNSSRTLQDIPRLARFLRAEQPDIL